MAIIRQIWSVNALSTELGLDRRTLGKRLETVPTAGENSRGTPGYRLIDVLSALYGGGNEDQSGWINHEFEKARAMKAQADKLERENAVALRDLLPAGEVARVDEAIYSAIKDALLALPDASAEQLCEIAVAEGPAGVSAFLRERIELLLEDASRLEIEIEDDAA